MQLTVAFDRFLPVARWGPLFHVLCLEQPGLTLTWKPVGFPMPGRPLLGDADLGLFVQPPAEEGLDTLVIESSTMVVVMAVGHPLTRQQELSVADVLDQSFPNGNDVHVGWRAFWTLDEHRGGPPVFVGNGVTSAAAAIEVVAGGGAIATLPAWARAAATPGSRLGRAARRPRRHDPPRLAGGRQGSDRARRRRPRGGVERRGARPAGPGRRAGQG